MADDFDPTDNPIDKLNEEDKHDEAIALANKLLEIKRSANDTAEIYVSRGDTYYKKQEYDKAITDYTKAIELKPDCVQAYNNRGGVYNAKKEFDKVIADCSKAIEINSDYATAYNNLGCAYNGKRDYARAIAQCTKAIELKSDYATAYNNRAIAYYECNDIIKSFDDFAKALSLDQGNQTIKENFLLIAQTRFPDGSRDGYEKLKEFLIQERGSFPAEIVREFLLKETDIEFLAKYYDGKKEPASLGIDAHFVRVWKNILAKYSGCEEKQNEKIKARLKTLLGAIQNIHKELMVSEDNIKMVAEKKRYLYQYAPYPTLRDMAESKRLWLTPACYQNDPEEGCFFFEFLGKAFAAKFPEEKADFKTLCDSVHKNVSTGAINNIVFIRSLSPYEDELLMWNSSYGDLAKGVSVGIPISMVHKMRDRSGADIPESALKNALPSSEKSPGGSDRELPGLPIEYVKCCHVLYLPEDVSVEDVDDNTVGELSADKNKAVNSKEKLLKKTNDLVNMPRLDFKAFKMELPGILKALSGLMKCTNEVAAGDDLKKLNEADIVDLFLPIAHLVKNETYDHENEYRLMFITDVVTDIMEKKQTFLKDSPLCLHIETEKLLFMDKRDPSEKVFVGPLRDPVVRLQDQHRFEYKYEMRMPFNPSKTKFRDTKAPLARDSLFDNAPSSPQKTPDAK